MDSDEQAENTIEVFDTETTEITRMVYDDITPSTNSLQAHCIIAVDEDNVVMTGGKA